MNHIPAGHDTARIRAEPGQISAFHRYCHTEVVDKITRPPCGAVGDLAGREGAVFIPRTGAAGIQQSARQPPPPKPVHLKARPRWHRRGIPATPPYSEPPGRPAATAANTAGESRPTGRPAGQTADQLTTPARPLRPGGGRRPVRAGGGRGVVWEGRVV